MYQTGSAQRVEPAVAAAPERAPIVIVGNGPVGMRVAAEVLARLPDQSLIVYGEEQHEPYDRVRLSSWLAGEIEWAKLAQPLRHAQSHRVEQRLGYRIVAIDRAAAQVVDSTGARQRYSGLVLAIGSRPFVPGIEGIARDGVYTFRDLDDANRLLARRARSHHTVVLGGGLLGLEAARGMQRGNTRVTLIEHADRLLGQQLDEVASRGLEARVRALGIEILVGEAVAEVFGRGRVEGLRLRSGLVLACDTLIVAAGIRPNIDLARQAGIAHGRGILVDDRMCTSDPAIYAVGECAEHRGHVYGLVGPGLEQAAVAAAALAGNQGHYAGSVAASRLKVVGVQVFSMGPVGAGEDPHYARSYVYRDDQRGIYRKLLVRRHRLVGAIGIGDWPETVRLQTLIGRAAPVYPWQVLRFLRSGRLWPEEDSSGVAAWPAGAVVCQCTGVTRGRLGQAIAEGACDIDTVMRDTGASTVCGSCRPLIGDLLGNPAPTPAVGLHRPLLAGALLALLAILAFAALPPIPYADSVQHAWHWEILWRDPLLKQISGFTILGLSVLALLLSLRKRARRLDRLGGFDGWRLAHTVLGVLVILALVAHTGLRSGHGLNQLLLLGFAAMLLVGALSSGVTGLRHRVGGSLAQRLQRQSVWLHILLFWPVPALLGWHVFKTYWF
jgi:nitrite reductase (NADH) large subunit